MGKREAAYQSELIGKLRDAFPGCFVLKNDSGYLQGVPDLIMLYGPRWAALEVKRSLKERSDPEPNQEFYVNLLGDMGFATFIYPENEEEVFDALQRSFEAG